MIADVLSGLLRPRAETGERDPLSNFWYQPADRASSSGVEVTTDSAMSVSTVFACVRVLAETFASLPFHVARQMDGYTVTDRKHPLDTLIHDQPNAWQTSFEWREMGMGHLLLRGNFYNRIVFAGNGDIAQLVPLNPDRMKPELMEGGRVRYTYTGPGGQKVYSQDEIFHVRGLSLDGLTGVSIPHYARHAIGLAIAEETSGGALFTNGGIFSYALETEKKLGKDGRENLRASWKGVHGGASKAHNPPVLEDGLKIHELGMNLQDSQWIEGRGFQAVDICRFFRVPPHLVGILDRATFSNIEQQSLEFVIYTMMPWAARWESAGRRDLLADRETYTLDVLLDGLLRGDIKSRYEAYNTGIQAGFLVRNEARRKENMPPIEGGDDPLEPLNMRNPGGAPSKTGGRDRESKENLAAAFDPLFADAAARLSVLELRGLDTRAEKANLDMDRWLAWAVEFYSKHKEQTVRAVAPLAKAWEGAGLGRVLPGAVAGDLCMSSLETLRCADDVCATVELWHKTKAKLIEEKIKEHFQCTA